MNKKYGLDDSSEDDKNEEEDIEKQIKYLNEKRRKKEEEKNSLNMYEKYYFNINNKLHSDYNIISLEEKRLKNEELLIKAQLNKVKSKKNALNERLFNEFNNFMEKPAHIIVKNMKEVYDQRAIPILNINTNKNSFHKFNKQIIKIIYKNPITYVLHEFCFLILDQYYCFIDLLNEATRFYNLLTPNDYLFKDLKGNIIDLTYTVNSYYPTLLEQNESDPTIFLIPIPIKKSYKFDKNEYNNKELIPTRSVEQINKILNDDLINIENTLLNKIFILIFYACFLILDFIVIMNHLNLKEIYGVNKAINNIIKSSFYRNNYKELDNNFENIYTLEDIYVFIYNKFLPSFNFYKNLTYFSINENNELENDDKNNQITKVLQNYYVIGQFRLTKIVHNPKINELENANYDINNKTDENITSFLNLVDIPSNFYFSYNLETDNEKCHTININPTFKNLNIVFFKLYKMRIFDENMNGFYIELLLYNPNLDFLIPVTIGIEKNRYGYIKGSCHVCVLSFLKELKSFKEMNLNFVNVLIILFFVFCMIITIHRLIKFIRFIKEMNAKNMKNELKKSITNFWTIFSFIEGIILLIVVVLRITLYLIFLIKYKDMKNQNKFYGLNKFCLVYDILKDFEIGYLSLLILHIFNYLEEDIKDSFFEPIKLKLNDILYFFVCYSIIIFGFAVTMKGFYGSELIEFNSLLNTVVNIFFISFGNFQIFTKIKEFEFVSAIILMILMNSILSLLFYDWLVSLFLIGNKESLKQTEKQNSYYNNYFNLEDILVLKNKFKRNKLILFENLWIECINIIKVIKNKLKFLFKFKKKKKKNKSNNQDSFRSDGQLIDTNNSKKKDKKSIEMINLNYKDEREDTNGRLNDSDLNEDSEDNEDKEEKSESNEDDNESEEIGEN